MSIRKILKFPHCTLQTYTLPYNAIQNREINWIYEYPVIRFEIFFYEYRYTENVRTWNFPSFALKNVSKDPFSINSVMIMIGLDLVTTPCKKMTLGCSNWPMILASVKKSDRALSELPGFKVLIATSISFRSGKLSLPRQTSPNSPKKLGKKSKLRLIWEKFIKKNTYLHRL